MRALISALLLFTAMPAAAQWQDLQFPHNSAQTGELRLAGTPTGVAACAGLAGLWTYTESTGNWLQVNDAHLMGTH